MPKQTFSQIVAFATLMFPLLTSSAFGQVYEVPDDRSSINPPPISDEEMKRCITLFNDAERLSEKIDRDRLQLDNSSQASVDAFNRQVATLNEINSDYNGNCEGKDSSSAERNTRELNHNNYSQSK